MKRKILLYNPKLKQLAKVLRHNMTLSEVLLWEELKQKQVLGLDFDRQKPILNYIVDFYCKDLMLAIEIDGNSHNGREIEDSLRQEELEKAGVRFIRFDDLEIKTDIVAVLRAIEDEATELMKNGFIGREKTHP